MDLTAYSESMDIAAILIRAIHLCSAAVLVGSAAYCWFTRSAMPAAFRTAIYAAIALLTGSGFYAFFMKAGFPKGYHMWFGIKMLLALHIFAVYLLIALGRGDEAQQRRRLTGIAISGFTAIVLAGVLRSLGA